MNKKVRKEILDNHLSFWLHWDDKILVERIKNSSKRPVAFQASNDELLNLIKKRSSIYSKARYKIDCNNLTKIEIVEKVVKIYEFKKDNSQFTKSKIFNIYRPKYNI